MHRGDATEEPLAASLPLGLDALAHLKRRRHRWRQHGSVRLQLAQLGALLVRTLGVTLRDRHRPDAADAAHVGEGGELGPRRGEPRAAGRSVRDLRATPPPDDAHMDVGDNVGDETLRILHVDALQQERAQIGLPCSHQHIRLRRLRRPRRLASLMHDRRFFAVVPFGGDLQPRLEVKPRLRRRLGCLRRSCGHLSLSVRPPLLLLLSSIECLRIGACSLDCRGVAAHVATLEIRHVSVAPLFVGDALVARGARVG